MACVAHPLHADTQVVASVLPSSRSVELGVPATLFATILNVGTEEGTNCRIGLASAISGQFDFQTTDPATNAPTGTPNLPISIAPAGSQTFVITLTPDAEQLPTEVALDFLCENAPAAMPISGVNTFLFSATIDPTPDVIALVATLSGNGVVELPDTQSANVFSLASVNVGSAGSLTVTADTGDINVPVSISLCETDPATSLCINPTTPTSDPVMTDIAAFATPTFGVFVTGTDDVPFDPAENRVSVRFADNSGATRGATSVAVRTLPPIQTGSGITLGSEFNVSLVADSVSPPAVIALADGGALVGWENNDGDLRLQRLNADGSLVGNSIALGDGSTLRIFDIEFAALANGNILASWHGTIPGAGESVFGQIVSATGTPSGGVFTLFSAGSFGVSAIAATTLGTGHLLVVATSDGSGDGSGTFIAGQVLDMAGTKIGTEFVANTTATGNQLFVDVAPLASGGAFVTFVSQEAGFGDGSHRGRFFDAAGDPVGTDFLLPESGGDNVRSSNPQELPDGRILLSWLDSPGTASLLKAVVLNSDGSVNGQITRIDTDDVGIDPADQTNESTPGFITLNDGTLLLFWGAEGNSGAQIEAQRFATDGTKMGDKILFHAGNGTDVEDPEFTVLADGSVMAVWQNSLDVDGTTELLVGVIASVSGGS